MSPGTHASAPASAPEADAWLTPGRFAALFGGLIVVCFPQVVAGFETFFIRDYAGFGYPLAFYHRESFWRGELPFWNPLNDCGLPFLAQWNTLTLYPPSLIYLLLPLPWSLGMFCLLHLFLAGLGMYLLARRWTGNGLAAAVAGVIYGFNGLSWHSLCWPNNIAALGWMPLVVLAVERAWQKGGRHRVALAALAGAMQMLAGAPEVILLTWCALGALWLSELLSGKIPRPRLCARFGLAGLLVAGLAAAQLLPFLQLLAHSQRDTDFGTSSWSMPATGLLNYLVPLFHLRPSLPGPAFHYDQPGQYWTTSYYLGVGAVALAGLAVWRARDRRTWVLLLLAAISLILALGDHAYVFPWLKRVAPLLGFMRFPIKFVVLATFAAPLLAARGVAWLQALPPKESPGGRRALQVLSLSLLLAIALIAVFAWLTPNPPPDEGNYDLPGTLLNAAGRAAFLAGIAGCLLVLGRVTAPKLRVLLRCLLVLLLWFDTFTHATQLSPTVPLSLYTPDKVREALGWGARFNSGEFRAMPAPTSVLKLQFRTVPNPEQDFLGRRLSLFGDYNLLDHLPKVDGFFSLYTREANAVNGWLYMMTNGLAPLKDFLGVAEISDSATVGDWIPRATAMPLITAGQQPVFADDKTAFQGVISEEFKPRASVYLPPEAAAAITASAQPGARVLAPQLSPQRLTAEIETPAPAMVVIAQCFYQPWRAYVDDQPVRLWRANFAYQGLQVPAGHHRIRLEYEDRMFRLGAILTLLTLAGCLIALARPAPRPKISLAPAPARG